MRTALLTAVLVLIGCSNKPRYQGDAVLGGFDFTANLVSDTCSDGGSTDFGFSGVLSYDTDAGKLFLDTNGVNDDDHVGTLTGTQEGDRFEFELVGEADRDFVCGPVHVVETLEGELFATSPDGGCDAFFDGGAFMAPDGGAEPVGNASVANFQPLLACGGLRDDAEPRQGASDAGCQICEIVFQLVGTRQ